MRILIAGATGLVGRGMVAHLVAQGHEVRILSRSSEPPGFPPGVQAFPWQRLSVALDGVDAVVNLAGENIGAGRWSPLRKQLLRESRLASTGQIVAAIQASPRRPQVLVNASAVGIYGHRDGIPVDESAPSGGGFLAELCLDWEAMAEGVPQGVRLVKLRLGVVLARDGGALPRMRLPIQCFAGCVLGSGRQGLSWIHLQDLVALIAEALQNPAFEGPINATAPCPVSLGAFTQELARQLHRPLWPIPAFLTAGALNLVLGEMAQEMLLRGALVRPQRALDLGFSFRFPEVEMALSDLIRPVRP